MIVDAPTIFERIVTGRDVELWIIDTCQKWSSTYLSEVERQHGYVAGTFPRVRSWVTAPSLDNWPEDQLPSIVVVSLGIAELPLKGGDGRHRARWGINIACICSARMEAQAREQSMLYLAAHRALLLQRQSLEGNTDGVQWIDEDYTQLVYDDARTLAAAQAAFTVDVDNVVSSGAGPVTPDDPLDPDTDPWPLPPNVDTYIIDVNRK